MKVQKIFQNLFKQKKIESVKNTIPQCPIIYDRNNVTAEEFRQYVQYLSKNKINKNFQEPDRFITQAEREAQNKHKAEIDEYRDFVHNLAVNNINRTFLQ